MLNNCLPARRSSIQERSIVAACLPPRPRVLGKDGTTVSTTSQRLLRHFHTIPSPASPLKQSSREFLRLPLSKRASTFGVQNGKKVSCNFVTRYRGVFHCPRPHGCRALSERYVHLVSKLNAAAPRLPSQHRFGILCAPNFITRCHCLKLFCPPGILSETERELGFCHFRRVGKHRKQSTTWVGTVTMDRKWNNVRVCLHHARCAKLIEFQGSSRGRRTSCKHYIRAHPPPSRSVHALTSTSAVLTKSPAAILSIITVALSVIGLGTRKAAVMATLTSILNFLCVFIVFVVDIVLFSILKARFLDPPEQDRSTSYGPALWITLVAVVLAGVAVYSTAVTAFGRSRYPRKWQTEETY